jgi:hypothetical protein
MRVQLQIFNGGNTLPVTIAPIEFHNESYNYFYRRVNKKYVTLIHGKFCNFLPGCR